MQIRKAVISDVEPLALLFNLYRIFYKATSDIEGAKKFIEERIKQNESTIFLAILDKEIVGFTQLYPIFSSVSMRRTWLLNDLYVHEKARKMGVAQALLKAASEYGVYTQSKWLLLQTANNNIAAQALYEKNGWQRVTDYFYELPI
jgi:ribosomal protein S18 acetylase RimI-like enzyme